MNIQWYPGHMTKTRRMIGENLKFVDVVAEIIDARIPIASRNPDIDELVGSKPRVVVLNRADQADPAATKAWEAHFRAQGMAVLTCDAHSGAGVKQFSPVMRGALKDQIAKWREKGQVGRPVRAMVVGIPNVGKSTFINKVAKKKSAKASDRPGVTRGKQWITVDQGLELLDTPGILWPKFEDETIGLHLAFTGAVRDAIMDVETLACHLMELLAQRKPEALTARFKIVPEAGQSGWDLLEAGGRKRGFLISGGEVDLERMANILLDEVRVYAAAVILPPGWDHPYLNDSKHVTEKRRALLYDLITQQARAWSVAWAEVEEIDQINILAARMLAMERAIQGLSISPDLALIDGNRSAGITAPNQTVVGGDGKSASIAAASILAKVSRDRYMVEMDGVYPQYGFAQHKGYPTKLHYQRLRQYGPCPIHRRSFLKKL